MDSKRFLGYLFVLVVASCFLISIAGATESANAKNDADQKESVTQENEDDTKWPPRDVSLQDDPSLWPGHLEELGSRFPQKKVDVYNKGFPSVDLFFNEHVLPSNPLLMKNAVNQLSGNTGSLPSETGLSDTMLLMIPQTFTTYVNVTSETDGSVTAMSIRKFLQSYQAGKLYIDDFIPTILKFILPFPKCLKCQAVLEELETTRFVFRPGSWTGPLRRENSNSVVCLVDGNDLQVRLVNFASFDKRDEVMDMENGKQSGVNIQNVDFTKYPALREVPHYHTALLKQKDCLYLPAHWLYQMNTNGRTISISLSWNAKKIVPSPKLCGSTDSINSFTDTIFKNDPEFSLLSLGHFSSIHNFLEDYVLPSGEVGLTQDQFISKLQNDKVIMKNLDTWDEECLQIAKEMFAQMDRNKDVKISALDFEDLDLEELDHVNGLLGDRLDDFKDIIDDQKSDKPASLKDGAKFMTGDYEKEIEKMLQDGFNEILKELKVPEGILLDNKDKIQLNKDKLQDESAKDDTHGLGEEDVEEIIDELDEEERKIDELVKKINKDVESRTSDLNGDGNVVKHKEKDEL